MTPLRQRMIQDLQLRGYSDRTVEAYVRSVAQLAKFYGISPDRIVSSSSADRELRHDGCLLDDRFTRDTRRPPPSLGRPAELRSAPSETPLNVTNPCASDHTDRVHVL
jgi:hypothetical protein